MQQPRPLGPRTRFFFMHLGGLVAVTVYFVLAGAAANSPAGVTRALWVALAVHCGYALLAHRHGELKQFDVALAAFFAVGAVAASAGMEAVLSLYRHYSPALLFTSLGMAALLPLALGREPFTVYFALRQTPGWMLRTPAFASIARVLAAFWGLLLLACAALCAWRPADPMFTFLLPNLLIFVVGFSANRWLPLAWNRWFPAPLPDLAEPLIMGLPLAFNRTAAGDARAVIQFEVSGAAGGDYWLRVERGRCETFEGRAPAADLTVRTPDQVWVDIAHGRVDGTQALMERRYSADGDLLLLTKLGEWFR